MLNLAEASGGDPSDMSELPQLRQQVLRAHSAAATCAAWSSPHRKLITGDAAGTVIVWAQDGKAGQWAQEMANHRSASHNFVICRKSAFSAGCLSLLPVMLLGFKLPQTSKQQFILESVTQMSASTLAQKCLSAFGLI
jgi:hypothetical protein